MINPRPTRNDEAVRIAIAAQFVKDNWDKLRPYLNEGDTQDEIAKCIAKVTRHGETDAFHLAKKLEDDGWQADSGLVNILDGYSGVEWDMVRQAEKAWLEANPQQPQYKDGDRGTYVGSNWRWKGKPLTVVSVDEYGSAKYIVRIDGETYSEYTSGHIINFEDVASFENDAAA